MGFVVYEVSDSQVGSLQSELFCFQVGGFCGQVLQGEFEVVFEVKEVLSWLLVDQECGYGQVLEVLQQCFQGVEEVVEWQLVELECSVVFREVEVEGMVFWIQEFEVVLKVKEVMIVERNLEIDVLNQWKVVYFVELEIVLLVLVYICCVLEQQLLVVGVEFFELQWF